MALMIQSDGHDERGGGDRIGSEVLADARRDRGEHGTDTRRKKSLGAQTQNASSHVVLTGVHVGVR